jgi:hypothetical protein
LPVTGITLPDIGTIVKSETSLWGQVTDTIFCSISTDAM